MYILATYAWYGNWNLSSYDTLEEIELELSESDHDQYKILKEIDSN